MTLTTQAVWPWNAVWIAGYFKKHPFSIKTSKPYFNYIFSPHNLLFSPQNLIPSPPPILSFFLSNFLGYSLILQFTTMNANQLHLIAELIEPTIRADNTALAQQNLILRQDIRQLMCAARGMAANNETLQDQVRYLEGIAERLMARVNLLEGQILDCDDPCHNSVRRVRRRLEYDSDTTILETVELFSDSD